MKKTIKGSIMLCILVMLPVLSYGQANEVQSLRIVLDELYADMLPLCSSLINVARGLAGFAALWYIASRIWKHIANAEPVDFYPLLRPFVLGTCILMFPSVLAVMNGILQPIVTGTASMVKNSNQAIAVLLKRKEDAIKKTAAWQMYVGVDGSGNIDKWAKYYNIEEDGIMDGIGNELRFAMAKASYNFRNAIKQWLSEILHILFEAAALCINTIRTFYLIVLAILGPLIFGISVFDGLHHTLTIYIARYINIFLWLPVANIFGGIIAKIQENMLKADIAQVQQYGDTFFSQTDSAYLIFLVMGIVGYFTVPGIANYIVHASGANTFLVKTTSFFMGSAQSAATGTVDGTGSVISATERLLTSKQTISPSHSSEGNQYMKSKLSGK
jgi:conjugative transposon TraJ protein